MTLNMFCPPSDLWLHQPNLEYDFSGLQSLQRKDKHTIFFLHCVTSFCLMHMFLPRPLLSCLLWSQQLLLMVRLQTGWRPAGILFMETNPLETWILLFISLPLVGEIFAGHFGRPNRMKLLIKYLSAGVKPSDRRWPLLQGKAFSGP